VSATAPPLRGTAPVLDAPGLAERVLAHAERRPDAPAVITTARTWSYGGLAAHARALRPRLQDAGARPGDLVAVPATRTGATVAAVLACLAEGLPVLLLSPQLPAELRSVVLEDAAARFRLEDDTVTPRAAGPGRCPAGTLVVLTTSGSSGPPKAVALAADGVDRFAGWASADLGLDEGTAVLSLAPLSFDLSLLDVWTTLAVGGRVVMPSTEQSLRGRIVLDLLDEHDVHLVQGVPMFFDLMAAAARPSDPRGARVREVVVTGDVASDRTLDAVRALFPAARLHNVYGATETNDSFRHVVTHDRAPLPVGRPLPGVRAHVAGPDGTVAADAVPDTGPTGPATPATGELVVHTPFAALGYLDPDRTAERFLTRTDPDGAVRTYFRTGDVVRRDADGLYHLQGRADRQVKIRGTAVNLTAVEDVLDGHPDVVASAVLAVGDPAHVVAVVQAHGPVPPALLREHCAPLLPRAALPSRFHVLTDPLPRTTTGKVDRRAALRLTGAATTEGHHHDHH